MITATIQNNRIAPRKARLVADMIRGKGVEDAHSILFNALKKAKTPLADLLDSAIANAINNFKLDKANLYIKEIMIDQGYVLKRHMPVSRGSAHPIKKKTSHMTIILDIKEKAQKKAKLSNKKI